MKLIIITTIIIITTEYAFGGIEGTLKGPNASSAEHIGDGRNPT